MKTGTLLFIWLFPLLAISQFKSGEDVTISTPQNDDVYLAGKEISIDAMVRGDAVWAVGNFSFFIYEFCYSFLVGPKAP